LIHNHGARRVFLLHKGVSSIVTPRVYNVGQNPWANSTHHGFGLGWDAIFLQISVRVNYLLDPPRTRLTPG